jgi:hypothetical protein
LPPVPEHYQIDHLPRSWRERVAFFQTYGVPNSSPEARQAYKALPFGAKLRINSFEGFGRRSRGG